MGLLRKVRVLMGALVHKPFMPKAEKVDLEAEPGAARAEGVRGDSSASEMGGQELPDEERVADLIAQRQRDEAD